ncbi:IS200/IS605 family transposase [soil metagenome]
MANTYTQIYIQFVFAVQNRISLINSEWEQELYKYITGIVQNNHHKLIAINGMPDHLHIFVGFHTTQSIAGLMRQIKSDSSEWINTKSFVNGKFNWQEGYGAFSYGRSQLDQVYNYIMNQKQHHKKRTFTEEYILMLQKFGISYDERYTFKAIE